MTRPTCTDPRVCVRVLACTSACRNSSFHPSTNLAGGIYFERGACLTSRELPLLGMLRRAHRYSITPHWPLLARPPVQLNFKECARVPLCLCLCASVQCSRVRTAAALSHMSSVTIDRPRSRRDHSSARAIDLARLLSAAR